MRWSWIPNAITVVRMGLAAPLAWLILAGHHAAALAVAAFAGLSDAIDGLLAKRLGWESELGGLLDPLADKLMLLACFVALTITGELPVWLAAVVIGRDVLIVLGAIAYHNLVGPLHATPTLISKATTLLQILLVLLVLVAGVDAVSLPAWLITAMIVLTTAATVASGLHYVVAWTLRARRGWRERRSSTGGGSPA